MSQGRPLTPFRTWLRLKFIQLTWLIFGVVEGLIGLRFALKLIAANPENTFARIIYGMTRPLMLPFADLTITPRAEGMVLEINALIAMAVYALLAWALFNVIGLIFSYPRTPGNSTYRREYTVQSGSTPTPRNQER